VVVSWVPELVLERLLCALRNLQFVEWRKLKIGCSLVHIRLELLKPLPIAEEMVDLWEHPCDGCLKTMEQRPMN